MCSRHMVVIHLIFAGYCWAKKYKHSMMKKKIVSIICRHEQGELIPGSQLFIWGRCVPWSYLLPVKIHNVGTRRVSHQLFR